VSLVTNNISGSANNNSKIGITGSVIFANTPSNGFPAFPGDDVVFFVSGSIGDQYKAKSVFGGDLVVSGSLTLPANVIEVTGSIEATLGFSGSLTQLVDGTSYLIAGNNITITSQSNGSITISSQGGGGGGYEQSFVDGDLVTGVLSINHGLSNDYVHVSVYDNNDYLIIPDEVIITGVGTVDVVLTSFTPLVGNWNVIISTGGSVAPAPPVNSVQYNDNNLFGGTSTFTYNGEIVQITGSLFQSNRTLDGNLVGFMGNDSATIPATIGPDVFFYVSGSKNSKDGSTPAVAVFGGDVVISGTLHGGSPLNIGSPVFTNSFYAGNSESIRPLTAPVTVYADVTTHVTTIETVAPGDTTVILADGLLVGQQKYIIGAVVTDPIVITPTTPHAFSTITIGVTGGSALLLWTPYGWTIISTYDATII
jgi:hypothetical protein